LKGVERQYGGGGGTGDSTSNFVEAVAIAGDSTAKFVGAMATAGALSPTCLTSSLVPDDWFYRFQTASPLLAAMFYRASR
jgi:hypothetical protein